jgi:hypothetical protein
LGLQQFRGIKTKFALVFAGLDPRLTQNYFFVIILHIQYNNGAEMSAETQKQYAILLIKAEAARAVSDFEDYRVLKAQAQQLTQKSL